MALGFSMRGLGAGNLGSLFITLTANPAGLVTALGQAERAILGSSTRMQGTITKLGIGITAALGIASVRAFAQFDEAMTNSASIMGDISTDMRKQLEETARTLATTSVRSAKQLAEGYGFLASAGLDAKQSQAALAVVEKFSVAGRFDLAKATELLAQSQAALGLTTEDATQNMINMTRVGDVLAKANNLALGTVEDFADALSNRAAAALRITNKEVEEGVAVLAAFAAQGIKGNTAGQQFAIVLRDLQRTSIKNRAEFKELGIEVFDSTGKMNNMADIISQMEKGLGGMSDEMKRATFISLGFQDRSLGSLLALLGTSDAIRKYEAELKKASGTMDQMRAKVMESFTNQLKVTWNTFNEILITVGQQLAPVLSVLNVGLKDLLASFSGLNKENSEWVNNVAPAFLTIIGLIGDAFYGWKIIIKSLQLGFADFALTVNKVWTTVLDGIVKAVAGVAKIFMRFQEDWGDLPGVSELLGIGTKGISVAPLMNTLREIQTGAGQDLAGLTTVVAGFRTELDDLANKGTFSERLNEKFADMNRTVEESMSTWEDYQKVLAQTARETKGMEAAAENLAKMQGKIGTTEATDRINAMFTSTFGEKAQVGQAHHLPGLPGANADVEHLMEMQAQKKNMEEELKFLQTVADQKVEITKHTQDQQLELMRAYNDRLRMLQLAQAEIVLGSASTMFGDLAGIAESFGARQSAAFKAMFVASKAFAIANATVQIATGIANAAAATPWYLAIPAIASVVAATAGIVSSIQAVQMEFGGGRASGGPVSQGKMYMVGEKGPEPFIPGSSGTILPNSSLGGKTTVIVNNFTDAQAEVRETTDGNDKTIEVIIARTKNSIASDIRQGTGDVSKSMQSSFGLKRAGR